MASSPARRVQDIARHITREEYVTMLQSGYTSQPAYLYEADQNPNAKFVLVSLGPAAPAIYKRIVKGPKS
jgi:hypothetical protein